MFDLWSVTLILQTEMLFMVLERRYVSRRVTMKLFALCVVFCGFFNACNATLHKVIELSHLDYCFVFTRPCTDPNPNPRPCRFISLITRAQR